MQSFVKLRIHGLTACRNFLQTSDKVPATIRKMPLSDMTMFRRHFERAKNIVVLTGAGVSAESGVPTFRGKGGFWRKYESTR
jgi:hypothetical protein